MRLPLPLLLSSLAAVEAPQTVPTTELHAGSSLRVGVEGWHDAPNYLTGHRRDTLAGPVLEAATQPSDHARFDVRWPLWVMQIDDPDFGTGGDFGDLELGATWVMARGLGLRWHVALPQTSVGDGLGTDTTRWDGALLAGTRWGDWRCDARLGLAIHPIPEATDQIDLLVWGAAARWDIDPAWALIAEASGLASTGKTAPGADDHGEARLGARWATGAFAFDAALRAGLTEHDGSIGFALGGTWTPPR